jgi:hypothetical protein
MFWVKYGTRKKRIIAMGIVVGESRMSTSAIVGAGAVRAWAFLSGHCGGGRLCEDVEGLRRRSRGKKPRNQC